MQEVLWHTLVRKLALPMEGGWEGKIEAAFVSCITYSFKIIETLILNAHITNPKQLSGPQKLAGRSGNRPLG